MVVIVVVGTSRGGSERGRWRWRRGGRSLRGGLRRWWSSAREGGDGIDH